MKVSDIYVVMLESRKDKFKRLASYRTNAILEKLRLLGNLSNKSNYEYSNEEINRIFHAIDYQLRNVRGRFINKEKQEFKL